MSSADAKPTKQCPFCGERILKVAVKCRYCQEILDEDAVPYSATASRRSRGRSSSDAERMLLPVDRPLSAIAAGYLGLLSPVPFVHFAALGVGIIALNILKKNPALIGQGRAWFGIVMGLMFTLLYGVIFLVSITH